MSDHGRVHGRVKQAERSGHEKFKCGHEKTDENSYCEYYQNIRNKQYYGQFKRLRCKECKRLYYLRNKHEIQLRKKNGNNRRNSKAPENSSRSL